MQINWLVLLLAVPLVGAIVCAFVNVGRAARAWALLVSIATLVVSLVIAYGFHYTSRPPFFGQVQFGYAGPALADVGISFRLGIDSISLFLILLTTGLTPLAIAASFGSIRERQKEYYAWMLALLVAMIGVFCARDLLLFYVFFELTLVPMFFIIGIWGGPERRYAAAKFFLFTFAGSVFTLAAAIFLGLKYGTFALGDVVRGAQFGLQVGTTFVPALSGTEQFWVLLGFLAGFAVKVPLFPVHTWLPLAHTEAPTAGSVILAGVLLKLGTYGLLRLALPIGMIHGDGTVAQREVLTALGVMCLVGIIYGALVAWVQQDIKKLVAYSSVSHLGFCVLGLIALNTHGVQGSILYMINHGISTGAMFLVIGMIYDRYHTRDINALSGLAKRMPVMAFFFVLFVMSSIGLPGTNGFVSEFLTILGAFTSPHLGIGFGVVAATGIVLGAIYMLHMTARVIWGPLRTPDPHAHDDGHGHTRGDTAHGTAHGQADQGQGGGAVGRGQSSVASDNAHGGHGRGHAHHDDDDRHRHPGDLNGREIAILIPLAIAVILLGVAPTPVLDRLASPVNALLKPRMPGPVRPANVVEAAPAADAEQAVVAGAHAAE